MPLSLSSVVIAEKNKLHSTSAWLIALEITVPGVAEPIRVVRNSENISWRSKIWIAFPFELEEIGEESKGEVPRVQIRVSNVSRAMELYLQHYDIYCKTEGYTPIEVSIFVVNSLDLANDDPAVQYDFELIQPKTDSRWATFTLGATNPFERRFPPNRMSKSHCRFRFNYPAGSDKRCGWTGSGFTECNKTLGDCRERSNSIRFGGTPGLGGGGITLE